MIWIKKKTNLLEMKTKKFGLFNEFLLCRLIHNFSYILLCKINILDISHIAPTYLGNIVEIFLGNIVRLLKYFETYH